MKKHFYSVLLGILLPVLTIGQSPEFNVQTIEAGLIWGVPANDSLFGRPQYVQYLRLSPKEFTFDLTWHTDTLVRTSDMAISTGATAAINGGFFDMKNGGSVTYLRGNGVDIHPTAQRLINQGNEILEGAVVINKKGRLKIGKSQQLERRKRYVDVLVTGPLLLLKGNPMPLDERGFNLDRHPRSCLCTDGRQQVYFITVDGRHQKASGMNLQELTRLATELGCHNAINLDGGGSTTLFLFSQGVINHPSDNRTFDHQGERPCANAFLARKK